MPSHKQIAFVFFLIFGFGPFLLPLSVLGQEGTPPNVRQASSSSDSIRLERLASLTRKVYWTKQPDSAFYCIEQMIDLAQRIDAGIYIRKGLRYRAQLYAGIGDYQSAIPAHQERIAAYEAATYNINKRYRALSTSHRELAYALRKLGRTSESLEQYERSLYYAEAIGEEGLKPKASALNSMGNLYSNLREYSLATEKYEAAYAIYQVIDSQQGIYSTLNNLGLVAAKTGNNEEALAYYETSLTMKKKAGDRKRMANTYGSIGDIYLQQERYDEAEEYFLMAKNIQEELGLQAELTRSLTQLGNLALLRGQPNQSLTWCTQSCGIAEVRQMWQARMACHECLYRAYKALGNNTQALQEHEVYIAVRDSVLSDENTLEIAAMEARLTYENQLTAAVAAQERLSIEAQQERLLRWVLVGATLALGILTWLAVRNSRLRRKQNEVLQEVAATKNQFFANISHELRTPLTLISSPLEELLARKSSTLDDPLTLRATLGTVKQNADKLSNLVEELLELAKLEAGSATVSLSPVEIVPLLAQTFSNYQPLADQKEIHYTLEVPTADFSVNTDRQRLEKIIDNLIGNALKFTPHGGQVSVRLSYELSPKPTLLLGIEDNGPGIPPEEQQAVFNRYYQGSQGLNATTSTGIGLALAQESAKVLGGQIELRSIVGQGSLFTLLLPATLVATNPDHNEPIVPSNRPFIKGRILVVEDNEELRSFLLQVLSAHDCTAAEDGQQALALLRQANTKQTPFQLVITDLMMPKMDGTSLSQQIKQDDKLAHVRLIVLTARREQAEKLNLLRIGVDDYLTKPFSTEELLARVSNLLFYQSKISAKENRTSTEDNDQGWLKQVEATAVEIIKSQQKLTAGSIANSLNISNRQLLRRIKAATGISTQLYLQECKLQLARKFLEEKQYKNVTEVAKASGFSTPGYFSRVYQDRFGKTPSTYYEV